MVLKIGNTSINYRENTSKNDFIILAQVVDSSMSYERPIIVRTPAELDMWFGKNFSQYDYLRDLLECNDVSLYLYKPIDTTGNSLIDTINFSYYTSTTGFYNGYEFLPEEGLVSTIYPVIEENGKYTYPDLEDIKYNIYIWKDGDYIDINLLPQFTELNTKSSENRDSLRLTCLNLNDKYNNESFYGPVYSYPKFYNISDKVYDKYSENISEILKNYSTFSVDMDSIESGDYTFAFNITFSSTELSDGWFMIPKNIGVNGIPDYIMAYKGPVPKDVSENYYNYKSSNRVKFETIEDLLNIFKEKCGYVYMRNSSKNYTLICNQQTILSNFYSLPEIESIEINKEINYNILSRIILDKKFPKADFFSKTIGRDSDENSNISITISHDDSELDSIYSIVVTRFNYTETFHGTIRNNIPGVERLDKQINKTSRLIYANFDDSITMLPEGTWELKRAKTEDPGTDYNPSMYLCSLDAMFNRFDEGSMIDFLLVDNIQKYVKNGIPDNYTSYQEYNILLDYSQKGNFQVLIQNNPVSANYVSIEDETDLNDADEEYLEENKDSIFVQDLTNYLDSTEKYRFFVLDPETNTLVRTYNAEKTGMIYGNDFVFNHTLDFYNRLVYFYGSINTPYGTRPGYYLFLDNIITGSLSLTRNNITAEVPLREGEDVREENNLVKKLKEYKCNYFVTNGSSFYYEKLQNGKYFYTSIWMRFISDKIKREFYKNRWKLIGEKMNDSLRQTIDTILSLIKKSFPIIVSLELKDFQMLFNENKLKIDLFTVLGDYPENDITLNVVLNYKES